MVISCLYVQTVTRQCFCFPNSQWGVTAHDSSRTHKLLKLVTLRHSMGNVLWLFSTQFSVLDLSRKDQHLGCTSSLLCTLILEPYS